MGPATAKRLSSEGGARAHDRVCDRAALPALLPQLDDLRIKQQREAGSPAHFGVLICSRRVGQGRADRWIWRDRRK